MRTHRIGGTQVDRVLEFEGFPAPADLIFPNCTPDIVAAGREWLDGRFIGRDADTLILSFHSFLVRSRGKTILVDTCHGNDKERPGMDYAHHMQTDYLANLARTGVRPEDIDHVLCTHLHFDHVGWNTRLENGRWVPTFPNARYLISKADYDWFSAGRVDPVLGCAFKDSILPVMEAGQVDLVDTGHVISHELGDGIWLEGAPGHTPGSVMLHCQDRHGHALFTGDVMHHPIQAQAPHLHIHGEADWEMAMAARVRMMEAAADGDMTVFAAHFPTPTAARFLRKGGEFRVDFPE